MGASSAASRFIMPIGDASVLIDTLISELEKDPVAPLSPSHAVACRGTAPS